MDQSMHSGFKKSIHSFHRQKPLFHELRSECLSKRMNERSGARDRSERMSEWCEGTAQYSMRRFHIIKTHNAMDSWVGRQTLLKRCEDGKTSGSYIDLFQF